MLCSGAASGSWTRCVRGIGPTGPSCSLGPASDQAWCWRLPRSGCCGGFYGEQTASGAVPVVGRRQEAQPGLGVGPASHFLPGSCDSRQPADRAPGVSLAQLPCWHFTRTCPLQKRPGRSFRLWSGTECRLWGKAQPCPSRSRGAVGRGQEFCVPAGQTWHLPEPQSGVTALQGGRRHLPACPGVHLCPPLWWKLPHTISPCQACEGPLGLG